MLDSHDAMHYVPGVGLNSCTRRWQGLAPLWARLQALAQHSAASGSRAAMTSTPHCMSTDQLHH